MMADEGKISIGVSDWLQHGQPFFDKGKNTASLTDSRIEYQGRDKTGIGLSLGLPGGGHNAVRISYFELSADGETTAATDLTLFDQGYPAGTLVATHYKLQSLKASYEYVTWPYPIGSRRFRLKTLWQVQFTKVNSAFGAPLSADPASSIAQGSKTIILPTLGIGLTQYLSRQFHVELDASGFGIPHHAGLGDVDAFASYKYSRLEFRGGFKYYYFKTSPQSDFYTRGNLLGAYVGLRFYLN
jgi:hypothetical protein